MTKDEVPRRGALTGESRQGMSNRASSEAHQGARRTKAYRSEPLLRQRQDGFNSQMLLASRFPNPILTFQVLNIN